MLKDRMEGKIGLFALLAALVAAAMLFISGCDLLNETPYETIVRLEPQVSSCVDKRSGEDRTDRGMKVLSYITSHSSQEWNRDLRTTKHDFYIYKDENGNELFSILVYGKFDVYSIELPGKGSSLWTSGGLNKQKYGMPVAAESEMDAALTLSDDYNEEEASRMASGDF